jgi:hypothetical protein
MANSNLDPRQAGFVIDMEKIPKAGFIKDEMIYSQRVFHYSYAACATEPHFLAFRGLQRINIVHLQNKLARHKGAAWKDMAASDELLQDLETTLHKYSMSKF